MSQQASRSGKEVIEGGDKSGWRWCEWKEVAAGNDNEECEAREGGEGNVRGVGDGSDGAGDEGDGEKVGDEGDTGERGRCRRR